MKKIKMKTSRIQKTVTFFAMICLAMAIITTGHAVALPIQYSVDLSCTRNCDNTNLMNSIGIPTATGDLFPKIRGTFSFDSSFLPSDGDFQFHEIAIYDLNIRIGNSRFGWDSFDPYSLTSPPKLMVTGTNGDVTDVHWRGTITNDPDFPILWLGYSPEGREEFSIPVLDNEWTLDVVIPLGAFGDDLFFAGNYSVSPVPEPATLLLFGSGCLAGLAVFRKKFRNS